MSHSADKDAPFFQDKETGEPCLRRGNVLCHNPDWRNHRHVAIHVIASDKGEFVEPAHERRSIFPAKEDQE